MLIQTPRFTIQLVGLLQEDYCDPVLTESCDFFEFKIQIEGGFQFICCSEAFDLKANRQQWLDGLVVSDAYLF